MSFLTPWTAVLAAACAVPLLLLLYFLKLRRRRLRMASTLLWRRSFRDLQVNTPFQRLRLSTLFVLQLLALLMLVLAAGEPVLTTGGPQAARVILLVDRSASMSAIVDGADAPRTRLDEARRMALEIVERRVRRGAPTAVMVIAFAARPMLVTGFETRLEVLRDVIAGISPTDEPAQLAAALQLAGTYATRREEEDEEPPDVILLSDGGVLPPDDDAGFALRTGRVRYVPVPAGDAGAASYRNVGIVAMSARRSFDDPSQVMVFVRLASVDGPRATAGPGETTGTTVSLLVDGTPGPAKRVRFAAPAGGVDRPAPPSEAAVTFSIERAEGAVLTARQDTRDALATDDTAAVVLPPPARPRIALVYGDDTFDPFLRDPLEAYDPASLEEISIAAYETMEDDGVRPDERFDVVVFDRVAPRRLPPVPSVSFGAVPPGIDVTSSAAGGVRVLSWNRQHPLMRHVSLDRLVFSGGGGMDLPVGATALASGPDGPVIAIVPARGIDHVVVSFAMASSNWPADVSVAVFLQNVLEGLTASRSGRSSLVAHPGEPVVVAARAGVAALRVTGPGLAEDGLRVPVTPGTTTLPPLRRVGLYAVEGATPPWDRVAVSLLSEIETDLRPVDRLVVNAETVAGGSVAAAAPRGIWGWFVLAALGLLVLEWLVYCRLVAT